jgi:hypothetical protein
MSSVTIVRIRPASTAASIASNAGAIQTGAGHREVGEHVRCFWTTALLCNELPATANLVLDAALVLEGRREARVDGNRSGLDGCMVRLLSDEDVGSFSPVLVSVTWSILIRRTC